jgi:hypothetical protein
MAVNIPIRVLRTWLNSALKGHDFTGCGKDIPGCKKCQGTTSVVPQRQQNEAGL